MAQLKIDLIVDDKDGTITMSKFGKTTANAMDLGNKHTVQLSKSMGSLTKVIGMAGAAVSAAGIGAVVIESVRSFGEFESALTDMAKVTDRDLALIRAEIKSLPPEIGTSTELMKGYYQTISAGVTDPAAALQTLTASAQAAKAAHIGQAETIKGITKLMKGYGDEISTASQAADLLFAIEKEGQTSFAELIPVIGDIATLSREMSVSQDEMGASMALLSQTAGSTSQAATQYQRILMGLYKPQEKMRDLLDETGYASGQAMVEQLGLAESIKLISKEAEASGVPIGKLFESSEALVGIAALGANNFADMAAKTEAMAGKAGMADKAFAAWSDTWDAVLTAGKSTLDQLAIELGGELMPALKDGVSDFADYVKENKIEIIDFLESMGVLLEGAATAATFLGKNVGWMPSWVADLSAGSGMVAGGELDFSQLATANRPELKQIISDFDAGGDTWQASEAKKAQRQNRIAQAERELLHAQNQQQYYTDNSFENWLGGVLHDNSPADRAEQRAKQLQTEIAALKAESNKVAALSEPVYGPEEAGLLYQQITAEKSSKVIKDASKSTNQEVKTVINYSKKQLADFAAEGKKLGKDMWQFRAAEAEDASVRAINAQIDLAEIEEKEREESAKASQRSAEDQAAAYRTLYSDLGSQASGYYDYKVMMIEAETEAMQEAGVDVVLSEQWMAEQIKNIGKESLQESERKAADRAAAYRTMYDDIGIMSAESFAFQEGLLEKERENYLKLTEDKAAVDEWYAQRHQELEDKKTLASDDFFGGMGVALRQLIEEQKSWAEAGYEIFQTFAVQSKSTLSNVLFDAIKNDMQSFDVYWESFFDGLLKKVTDTVADMAIAWGVDALGGATGWWDKGAWEVKKDHVAVVHAGEMIIPADVAQGVRDLAAGGSSFSNYGLGQEWSSSAGAGLFESDLVAAGVQGTLKSYGLNIGQGLSYLQAGQITSAQFLKGAANPSLMASSFLSGGITSMGLNATGMNVSGDWASIGAGLASMVGPMLLGLTGIPGALVAGLSGIGGGILGDSLGDLLDMRPGEAERDYMEDIFKQEYELAQAASTSGTSWLDDLNNMVAGVMAIKTEFYNNLGLDAAQEAARIGGIFAGSGGDVWQGFEDYATGKVGDYPDGFGVLPPDTGIAHAGLDYVPREMTMLVDKGERIVKSRTNEDLTNFLADQKNNRPSNGFILNAPLFIIEGNLIADQDTFDEFVEKIDEGLHRLAELGH